MHPHRLAGLHSAMHKPTIESCTARITALAALGISRILVMQRGSEVPETNPKGGKQWETTGRTTSCFGIPGPGRPRAAVGEFAGAMDEVAAFLGPVLPQPTSQHVLS